MQKFKSVEELVNQLKPTEPVYCIRKKSIQLASKYFQNKFPGKVLYAVKTNPHPIVLKTIIESGVENFDVASIKEIEAIRKIKPNAKCSYMHTVKSRESIKEAYFKQAGIDPKEKGAYVEYDKEKTMVNMLKYRHWGPWDLSPTWLLGEKIPDKSRKVGKKKEKIGSKELLQIKQEQ